MDISLFDYPLPEGSIAQNPVEPRDNANLLVVDRGGSGVFSSTFREIDGFLRPGDLLVFNDTRVFPARLWTRRATGRRVEILLLFPQEGSGRWRALVRPDRPIRPGEILEIEGSGVGLTVGPRDSGPGRPIDFAHADGWAVAEQYGHTPLPPYIRRPDEPRDRERYQTVFARHRGAVAAPTAGLHFTGELLDRLSSRGISRVFVTLHVGWGTFRPIRADAVEDHRVDPEYFRVPPGTVEAIRKARAEGRRVIAVGTTTVRTLETMARRPPDAPAEGWTDLVIRPPFEFLWVDALVTNFHLPRSSLLVLVSAFAGRERILAAYRAALRLGYRFYSYGDGMLIL